MTSDKRLHQGDAASRLAFQDEGAPNSWRSELNRSACQPRTLECGDERAVRLIRIDAELVLPPAISSEDCPALWQVPQRLAHIEDEYLLGQVLGRAYETRAERLAGLATTFRPMHDHQGFILQRKPGRQEAQRLRIIDFDGPGRIELDVPTGIGNGLEREGRREPVVLPLLVGEGSDIQEALVRSLEVELQTGLNGPLGRSQGGVVSIDIGTKRKLDVGQGPDRENLGAGKLVPTERAAEETVDLRVSGTALRPRRIERAILIARRRRRTERRRLSIGRLAVSDAEEIRAVGPHVKMVEEKNVLRRVPRSGIGGGGEVVIADDVVIDDEQGRRRLGTLRRHPRRWLGWGCLLVR